MTTKPRYYDCEICGGIHPWEFNGDCRDDANRFTAEALDTKHGQHDYELLPMDERVAADNPTKVAADNPTKKVSELVPGDLVDLENDPHADPNGEHPEFEFEFATVGEIVKETAECTVVYFDNFTCGFPPDHVVKIGTP